MIFEIENLGNFRNFLNRKFCNFPNWVGAKTLNDKILEWPKSRNSKLSKFKCRKVIITNDSKVLNKTLRTQRCRKKFKSKANIRMLEITKGKITN